MLREGKRRRVVERKMQVSSSFAFHAPARVNFKFSTFAVSHKLHSWKGAKQFSSLWCKTTSKGKIVFGMEPCDLFMNVNETVVLSFTTKLFDFVCAEFIAMQLTTINFMHFCMQISSPVSIVKLLHLRKVAKNFISKVYWNLSWQWRFYRLTERSETARRCTKQFFIKRTVL